MATEQDQRIGEAVIALRADRTQQAVADDMRERGWKWSQATVWSVEKGERPLRLAEAGDLAALFGVRLEDLLAETAGEEDPEIVAALGEYQRARQQLIARMIEHKRARERYFEAEAAMSETQKAVGVANGVTDRAAARLAKLRGEGD